MNYEFKKGDKVKIRENCSGMKAGDIAIISKNYIELQAWAHGNYCSCQNNWILIEKATNETEIEELIKSKLI